MDNFTIKCSRCLTEKSAENNFYKSSSSPDGYAQICKSCRKMLDSFRKQGIEFLDIHPPENSGYKICSKCNTIKKSTDFFPYKKGGSKMRPGCRQCYIEEDSVYKKRNREHCNKQANKRRNANLEKNNAYQREYIQRPHVKEKRRAYSRRPEVILSERLRVRLRNAIREHGGSKEASTLDYLGCDMHQFRDYIEKLFTEGMTWDKVASSEIHLDHIEPYCSIDLRLQSELRRICHYTNVRPIWAKDNLKKIVEDKKKKFIPTDCTWEEYQKQVRKVLDEYDEINRKSAAKLIPDQSIQNIDPDIIL